MRSAAFRLASTLAALALALACAGARLPLDRPEGDARAVEAPAAELARAGFDAWLLHDDAETAGRRFAEALRREPGSAGAHLGASMLAARALDDASEVRELLALVEAAPLHPASYLAARRLGELAERSPSHARDVADGLARAQQRATGLTAARLRNARAAAAAAQGDLAGAVQLRSEGGAVTAWTIAGPYGALHALELDVPFPPEEGSLPATAPSPPGLPAVSARALETPAGDLALEGEPGGGDFFYLASDVALERGGAYLLHLATTATLRAFVDGAPVAERRSYEAFLPFAQAVPLRLAPGRHRLLVKLGRGGAPAWIAAYLAREDGAPADAQFTATTPGEATPRVRAAELPRPLAAPGELLEALAPELGPLGARLALARDLAENDRETAKALLEEALAQAPRSAALLAVRAEVRRSDGTLAERIARARAESDLDAALVADPGHAAARLARAEAARTGDRLDDAATLLEALSPAAAARPAALVERARLARARGLEAQSEALAEEARRGSGSCSALELLLEGAVRREVVARQDELTTALSHCPSGLERLAAHRRRRGDLAGALEVVDRLVKAGPARIEPRLIRARLLAARGEAGRAVEELAVAIRTWPRDARLMKAVGELRELAGDAEGAREALRQALLLDGSDLGLRRALALERGVEPLSALDEDGLAAIRRYREAAPSFDTSSVTVLDLGAVEAHPGGSLTQRIHTVVEARDQRAVDRVGEVAVPAGAEILVARTVKRDGRVLEPAQPLGDKRTLSLPGLEPGDFAEWSWLQASAARGAALPGFSADTFYFRADVPLWRSLYTAVAPQEVPLEVDAHHMPAPEILSEDGRQMVRVLREAVPPLRPEPSAPGEAEVLPAVQIGSGAGQEALALALADGLMESFRPSLEVKALAGRARAAAKGSSPEALARAAHRLVDEVVLGQGGNFAESASAILSRGRGNRTVLLDAVLRALGVPVRAALLRDFARDPAPYRFPRPELHAYAVLRVEDGGRELWIDPTTRFTPFGELPNAVRGVEALLLPARPGERLERTTTPPPNPNQRRVTRVKVQVEPSGDAVVEGAEAYQGFDGAALRASLEPLDTAARRQAVEAALSRGFASPQLLSFEVEGEESAEAPLVLRWKARVPQWARLEGDRAVVDAPLFPAQLVARFVQRASRETPVLIAGDERYTLEVTVIPPPGWRPVPVERAAAASLWGSYLREEKLDGGRLERRDAYDLSRARVNPGEEYAGFATFAVEVDRAQRVPVTFDVSTQGLKIPSVARLQTP